MFVSPTVNKTVYRMRVLTRQSRNGEFVHPKLVVFSIEFDGIVRKTTPDKVYLAPTRALSISVVQMSVNNFTKKSLYLNTYQVQ